MPLLSLNEHGDKSQAVNILANFKTSSGPILDPCSILVPSVLKKIFQRKCLKNMFRGLKQAKCPFSKKNTPIPPMSKIGPKAIIKILLAHSF